MGLVKIRKKIFKREFLDYKIVVVVFDICELSQEDGNMVVEINKVFWMFPMMKGMDFDDQEIEKMIQKENTFTK
ncbi:hypothetical protein HYZ41_00540 [archaeon]|nr:hypothetical protein [archaeon]